MDSLTLLSARIQFLDTQLTLIHIPLRLYSSFLQPILQLLLPTNIGSESRPSSNGSGSTHQLQEHVFINVSVTPVECSIACPRAIADSLFAPARDALSSENDRNSVVMSTDDYCVMQVEGEGLEAGQRVLELTSPLAMAGVSIFFITTYYSDYILVPQRSRAQVVSALEARGFAFEASNSSYTSQAYTHRSTSSTSSFEHSLPGTPPPASISELQTRTFATLKKHSIVPTVDRSIRLIQCSARKDSSRGNSSTSDKLKLGLVRALVSHPKFLSLALTDEEDASLLLEKEMIPFFGPEDDSVLLGSSDGAEVHVPIILDLRMLPLESTGIICGVAGRLVGGTSMGFLDAVEMSYLSTARAGTVMVAEPELDRALGALRSESGENGVVRSG
ncbi:ACT domain-containing protein [Venturia nashicola]|uniref:ACT domain-containing protein n=1 Tax=Venturia nashicola TaxID=86259 RepID=A0A4Z1P5A7_9PEZI|nr:ACT domain-containing protein [Venturia nashicola]